MPAEAFKQNCSCSSAVVLCPRNHGRPNDASQVVECCCQPAVHCIT